MRAELSPGSDQLWRGGARWGRAASGGGAGQPVCFRPGAPSSRPSLSIAAMTTGAGALRRQGGWEVSRVAGSPTETPRQIRSEKPHQVVIEGLSASEGETKTSRSGHLIGGAASMQLQERSKAPNVCVVLNLTLLMTCIYSSFKLDLIRSHPVKYWNPDKILSVKNTLRQKCSPGQPGSCLWTDCHPVAKRCHCRSHSPVPASF